MTPERYQAIINVLSKRQPTLTVLSDEVHKVRNLSAIVRNCDAVGIGHFHCVEPQKGYRDFQGTALGTNKWVQTHLYSDIGAACQEVKTQGFRIVAANLSDKAVNFDEVDYTQPTCLLLGTEKQGVSAQALAYADEEVVVPMVGMVESFNVSVACGIILMEAHRQRQRARMYDQQQIAEEEFERLRFQWGQPIVTKFCDEKGLAYPPLDDGGEIIEPSKWYEQVRLGNL